MLCGFTSHVLLSLAFKTHQYKLALDAYLCKQMYACMQVGAVTGRTTNFSRTIATLQGVLTGLYPQASEPIPVATASDVDEIMFANVTSCERLADVMKQARYDLRGESLPRLSAFMDCIHQHGCNSAAITAQSVALHTQQLTSQAAYSDPQFWG